MGPCTGRASASGSRQISRDALAANQVSLYPALQRLERAASFAGEWGDSENEIAAPVSTVFASRPAEPRSSVESWRRFAAAIEVALDAR